MRLVLRTLRTQWLGALGLLVGVSGVAFGATGQPALLGKLNQADAPTTLQNTANGPAATFRTKSSAPPFTVTSGKKVPKLNASKLGGKSPSAFAPSGASYTKVESDGKFAPKTGSTAYAPAGSSYTKAESDGKYPLASNVYTKTAADARFAPVSGSPSYVPVGYRTLAVFGADVEDVTDATSLVFPARRFTAPADGFIVISLSGTCFGSAANTNGNVSVSIDGAGMAQVVSGTLANLCDVTKSTAVEAGIDVEVTAGVAASGGTVSLHNYSGTVYFLPLVATP